MTKRPENEKEYADLMFQMLGEFNSEVIKVDTILILVKMALGKPIENAILFATGDSYRFGAITFDTVQEAYAFLNQLSNDIAYGAFLKGKFHMYQYPYHSRSRGDWVFLPFLEEWKKLNA